MTHLKGFQMKITIEPLLGKMSVYATISNYKQNGILKKDVKKTQWFTYQKKDDGFVLGGMNVVQCRILLAHMYSNNYAFIGEKEFKDSKKIDLENKTVFSFTELGIPNIAKIPIEGILPFDCIGIEIV
jgi:hypothetical protein